MKITIDTTSMEALEACGEQIKAEIARIEKESAAAREKGTGKTKQVKKTAKKQKDILEEYIDTYEGLLHAQRSVASFKGALTRRQKREQELAQIREDEQIFEEALVAESEYAAARKELDDERATISAAYDAHEASHTEETERRLEESRARIRTAFAAVERAKAEAERTAARLDERFPNVHLAEANVHDAKAEYEELLARRSAPANTEKAEEVVTSTASTEETTTTAHTEDVVRQQQRVAAEHVATVTGQRAEEAADAAHQAEIVRQQGVAAGRDVTRVLDARAQEIGATEEDIQRAAEASEAVHRNNLVNDQRSAAAGDVSRVITAQAEEAAAQAHNMEITDQQRRAAQDDLVRVLRETYDRLLRETHVATIASEQKSIAAEQVAAVTGQRAEEAAAAAHQAEIVRQQGVAAGRDVTRVLDEIAQHPEASVEDAMRAALAADVAHQNDLVNGQRSAAAEDVSRVTAAQAEEAAAAARQARIEEQQGKAARNDVTRVMGARAGQYGLTGDQIVQNLPPRTPLNEVYTTPGMTEEEIEESKQKLAGVPEGNATPTISWAEMSDRINTLMLKKEHDDKNLTPDDIYALYFLRKHPEAAPNQNFVNDLLVWAGISPLERTTPRATGPAPAKTTGNQPKTDEPVKAMTDEEIERARRNISGDTTTGDHILTDEEIERMRQAITGQTPEHTEGPQGKTPEQPGTTPTEGTQATVAPKGKTPEQPGTTPTAATQATEAPKGKKAKKVCKREPFKTRWNKRLLVLKCILFGENLNGKSPEYANISILIANLRANYKKNSHEDNRKAIEKIDSVIKGTSGMTYEETTALYKKLVKLSKKIDKGYKEEKTDKKEKAPVNPELNTSNDTFTNMGFDQLFNQLFTEEGRTR